MKKYTVGIDFGTLSARAVLIDTEDGREVGEAVFEYPHGVMSDALPESEPLPEGYALEHPEDYITALGSVIREVMSRTAVTAEDIIGVGVDFTSSTMMAVDEKGDPLCADPRFASDPHAYVKLWKHHGAIAETDRINKVATERGEAWLSRYGGKLSCEFLLPKVYETARKSPEVYNAAYRFTEAGDFIVWKLTGKESHSVCTTGFKSAWDERYGYPSDDFFRAVDPVLSGIVGDKLSGEICPMDRPAGYITEEAAALTGLAVGTPVAPALIDAHSALPASGIRDDGAMLMIIGTSTCHILVSEKERPVSGISGYTKDALYGGKFVYEAGQSAVGDAFDWFVKSCVPNEYYKAAAERGENIHEYLSELARDIIPREDSPVILDWWNGCRAPYSDGTLKGCITGIHLGTKPEELYRAMLESTAYGAKRIIELYRDAGIEIREVAATGGIPQKNPLLAKIYADVIGMPLCVPESAQSSAKGAALLGMVAAGIGDLSELAGRLSSAKKKRYVPDPERTSVYEVLYKKYKKLSEFMSSEI